LIYVLRDIITLQKNGAIPAPPYFFILPLFVYTQSFLNIICAFLPWHTRE